MNVESITAGIEQFSSGDQDLDAVAQKGLSLRGLIYCESGSVIHYELLPPGKTINTDLYCQQPMTLQQEVEKRRPELINRKGLVFHHDNARPHTCLATQRILRKFG
ncbi:Histone-lysine N-methyltransferase SETMAR [Eumeta japonica]|uniref:Histone-lysine N-methyltransferase SETMAR n=1 Tax=Eumeta variegata TaxID=151549 RepID=A0A4C1WLW5_EUMVA|nr:Histone-lysine N-methyltransferase SETMAR [Eumeta japonica]